MLLPDQPELPALFPELGKSFSRHAWTPGSPLSGVIVPLVTPLASRDQLDYEGLGRLIEKVLAGGVDAIFLLGTTGEAASLAPDLRRHFVEVAVRLIANRVPVLVGVTDNSIVTTIYQAEHAAISGVDAVVMTTPFYLTPDSEEIHAYVRTVAEETTLPIFLYNMPRLTKAWFDPELVDQLMEIEQVVGIKDSSGDMAYFQTICELGKRRSDWSTLVGVEELMPEGIRLGGHGCVAGGGHIWPQLLVSIYAAEKSGDAKRVEKLQIQLAGLHRIFDNGSYALGGIRAIKTALNILEVCSDRLSDPFAVGTSADRDRIEAILTQNGLIDKQGVPIRQFGTNGTAHFNA